MVTRTRPVPAPRGEATHERGVRFEWPIRRRTWTRDHVGFPRGHGHGVGVGGVTAPQTLDKLSGWHAAPDKVFLALLLLNLQRKTGTQYSCGKGKE